MNLFERKRAEIVDMLRNSTWHCMINNDKKFYLDVLNLLKDLGLTKSESISEDKLADVMKRGSNCLIYRQNENVITSSYISPRDLSVKHLDVTNSIKTLLKMNKKKQEYYLMCQELEDPEKSNKISIYLAWLNKKTIEYREKDSQNEWQPMVGSFVFDYKFEYRIKNTPKTLQLSKSLWLAVNADYTKAYLDSNKKQVVFFKENDEEYYDEESGGWISDNYYGATYDETKNPYVVLSVSAFGIDVTGVDPQTSLTRRNGGLVRSSEQRIAGEYSPTTYKY